VLLVFLATAAPVEATSCQHRARRAKAEADVRALATAISMYSVETGALPPRLDALSERVTTSIGVARGPFINRVPDPSPGWTAYEYRPGADGTFTLATRSDADRASVRFGPDGMSASVPSAPPEPSTADVVMTVIVVGLVLVALAWPWLRARGAPARLPAAVREASAGQGTLAILLFLLGGIVYSPMSCGPLVVPVWASLAMVAAPVLLVAALAARVWLWARRPDAA
jgi:hypothetical protein